MSAQTISGAVSPLRVLLVEDSPADARMIQTILRSPSFQLTTVDRLAETLTVLRSKKIDVILLDLNLPDSHGLDTLGIVLEEAPGTAIVVLTGNDDQQAALDAVARGARDYLIKGSANAETIVRSIRHAFERGRAEENYRLILNSIADGVHALDADGMITFENTASAAMLGWEPHDLTGKAAHATIHHSHADASPREETDCPIMATLRDGVVRQVSDDVFWRKDGTSFSVEYVAAPTIDSTGEMLGVVVVFRDVTKQREMQRQVDEAIRVSSLGRVAASVAHEFNNVLMSIQPFVDILQRYLENEPNGMRALRYIRDGVKRGRLVSHEILRFAIPAEPHLTGVDAGEWLRTFSEEARQTLREHTLETDPAESMINRADAAQLSQVMLNLISNARDASPSGSKITIGAARADAIPFLCERLPDPHRFAALFVRDRGPGIAPEVLERIFEPLFTTKRSGETGLGLAVVQQIVAEHGGKVIVESAVGAGSTFYVVLPLEDPEYVPPVPGGENSTM
jgi:PAS domain S-box-containing protein